MENSLKDYYPEDPMIEARMLKEEFMDRVMSDEQKEEIWEDVKKRGFFAGKPGRRPWLIREQKGDKVLSGRIWDTRTKKWVRYR